MAIKAAAARVEDLAALAPTIDIEAKGKIPVLTPCVPRPLRGLTICGKSTQNGVPSLEAPASITSTGGGGSITVKVLGGNLFNAAALASTTTADVTISGSKITLTALQSGTYRQTNMVTLGSAAELDGKAISASVTEVTRSNTENSPIIIFRWVADGVNISTAATFYPTGKKLENIALSAPEGATALVCLLTINQSGAAAEGDTCAISGLMVNIGTAALPYEAYTKESLSISVQGGLCGLPVSSGGSYTDENGQQWICDTAEFTEGGGKLVRRVGNYTFDGSADEGWYTRTREGVENHTVYVIAAAEALNYGSYCSIFPRASGSWEDDTHWFVDNGNLVQFFMPKADGFVSVDDWRGYLAENPVQVVYALKTAKEAPLSDEEIAAFKALCANPVTTVTNSAAAEQAVVCAADTKAYIDNKFNELATAITAIGGE